MQSYEFLNTPLENFVAWVVPWIELLFGVFLVLGLWLKFSLRAVGLLIWMFIFIVSQALIRELPIKECGCFGGLISFPLHVVLIIDSVLLMFTGLLIKNHKHTSFLSLDSYFD